jgi:hypothetical protein
MILESSPHHCGCQYVLYFTSSLKSTRLTKVSFVQLAQKSLFCDFLTILTNLIRGYRLEQHLRGGAFHEMPELRP